MNYVGDKIQLATQDVEIIKCEKCGALMVNIDQNELREGDLMILKAAGVRISNPSTKDPVCLNCEIDREEGEHTIKRRVRSYFDSDSSSHHSDSSFFGGGHFGGGGFGGFGGGSFSGGGATGGF